MFYEETNKCIYKLYMLTTYIIHKWICWFLHEAYLNEQYRTHKIKHRYLHLLSTATCMKSLSFKTVSLKCPHLQKAPEQRPDCCCRVLL